MALKFLAIAVGLAGCLVAQVSPIGSPVHLVALITAIAALVWALL